MTLPAQSVGASQIVTSAGLPASTLQHRINKSYSQPGATDSAADSKVVHIAYAAGTLLSVKCGLKTVCTSTQKVTVDVKYYRDGAAGQTMLTAPYELTASSTAMHFYTASINSSYDDYLAEDIIEVIIALSGSGTIGKGVFVELVCNEDAA
jgi:acyl-coenzyme A synthetase/AMP-(fatty) acid ligase